MVCFQFKMSHIPSQHILGSPVLSPFVLCLGQMSINIWGSRMKSIWEPSLYYFCNFFL